MCRLLLFLHLFRWSGSLSVCGVGWSNAVTKCHLMRADDDREFEIVITRSHSLLCFLTASWIINQYFNVNWAGSIREIQAVYARMSDRILVCPTNVPIWLHRQCNNRWCRVQTVLVYFWLHWHWRFNVSGVSSTTGPQNNRVITGNNYTSRLVYLLTDCLDIAILLPCYWAQWHMSSCHIHNTN